MTIEIASIDKVIDRAGSLSPAGAEAAADATSPNLTLSIQFDQPEGRASLCVLADEKTTDDFRAVGGTVDEKLPLTLTRNLLAGAVSRCRKAWIKKIIGLDVYLTQCEGIMRRDKFESSLLPTLADAGKQMFTEVFVPKRRGDDTFEPDYVPSQKQGEALRRLLSTKTGLRIAIESRTCVAPWAMLYLARPYEPMQADMLLGARHIIWQAFPGNRPMPIERQGIGGIGVHFDTSLDDDKDVGFVKPVASFREFLGSLRLAASERNTRDALLTKIGTLPEELYLFICHGFPNQEGIVTEEARVQLTDGKDGNSRIVTPGDIWEWCEERRSLKGAPIVFMNACSIMRADFETFPTFPACFMDLEASAVIGPEIEMSAIFARDFLQAFLRGLMTFGPDHSVGQTLLALRRHYLLEHGNPLALAYSLYGSAATFFVGAVAGE